MGGTGSNVIFTFPVPPKTCIQRDRTNSSPFLKIDLREITVPKSSFLAPPHFTADSKRLLIKSTTTGGRWESNQVRKSLTYSAGHHDVRSPDTAREGKVYPMWFNFLQIQELIGRSEK